MAVKAAHLMLNGDRIVYTIDDLRKCMNPIQFNTFISKQKAKLRVDA